MRGLLLASGFAALIFLAWSNEGAVGVLHSTAAVVAASMLGWIALCVLLIRAIAVGGAGSQDDYGRPARKV